MYMSSIRGTILGLVACICAFTHITTMYAVCKNNEICPEPQSCKTLATRLDQVQKELSDCCVSLTSRCAVITNAVSNCETSSAIDQDFINSATPQITQSGTYCLAESVVGDLVIDADNVTINMNGFTITANMYGIRSTMHTNINILGNGVVENAMVAGIALTDCTDITIQGMRILGNSTGLLLTNVDGLLLNANDLRGSSLISLHMIGTKNGRVNSCLITDGIQGITIDSTSADLTFQNVQVSNSMNSNWSIGGTNCRFTECFGNSGLTGFSFDGTALDCLCEWSSASLNSSNGFVVTGTKVIVSECQSLQNSGSGFVVQTTNACLQNNFSKGNGVNGFSITDAVESYLKGNTSLSNTGTGYAVSGGTDNLLFGNFAYTNGSNYSGITDPIVTFTNNNGLFTPIEFPSIWQNIDAIL